MIIPLSCVGQSKFKRGIVVGGADNVVIDSIEKIGSVVVLYTSGAAINAYNDSIAILQTALTAAESRLSALEGGDITSPYVDSAYINSTNDSLIYIYFNEEVQTTEEDSVKSSISFTYGATSLTPGVVDSTSTNGQYTLIYCGTNIPSDSVVYVTYSKPTSGGIQDFSNNFVYDFTKLLTFNGTASVEYTADGFWKFNSNLNDVYGNYNGTAVNTIGYTGDTALYFSEADGDDAVSIGDMITSNTFTIGGWVDSIPDANEFFYIAGNAASSPATGWQFYYDR